MFVSLDGVALEVEGAQTWVLVPGVKPFSLIMEIDRTTGRALFDAGGEGDVVIKNGGPTSTLLFQAQGEELKIQGLTILALSPSNNVNTLKLQLVDQRWFWSYPFVARRYNVRRKSLATRVVARVEGDVPIEVEEALRVAADDVTYAQWSLNRGKAWTAAEILADVMDRVVGAGNWDDQDAVLTGTLPEIEGLELQAQGDTAISQALAAVGGGVGVYVQASGRPALYAVQGGGESAEVGLVGTRTRGSSSDSTFRLITEEPLMEIQDNRRKRPRLVRVLFERLVEGRVDFTEGADQAAGVTQERGTDPIVPITAFNVFPMPEDGTIPATGERGARKVTRGTWVTLADLLAFFGANPAGNTLAAKKPLTSTRIRRFWFSNALNAYAHPVFDKGGVWQTRIAIIREHYRLTYRVTRPWVDRFKTIQPYRVAIEDQETGARAPATVFQDYTAVFSWDPVPSGTPADQAERDLTKTRNSNPEAPSSGGQIVGTPIVSPDPSKSLRPAPALVRILDNDQAIIQLSFVTDFSGIVDRYERSGTAPIENGRRVTSLFGARKILLGDEKLSPEHEVSVVLTFSLGSPNDNRRFFPIDVTLQDAEKLLPKIEAVSRTGLGPVLEIRVGAPRAVARFAWDDELSDQFERAFATIPGQEDQDPNLGDPINLDELTAWARAIAAKEFARFRDHPEGALTTSFRPAAKIQGTITAVRTDFSSDLNGGALTRVELAPTPPPLDSKALVPGDVRRMIEGFVER